MFKKFLASIFHSEKIGSAQGQRSSAQVQPAEPLLNLAHELVCRRFFLDLLTFLDHLEFLYLCILFREYVKREVWNQGEDIETIVLNEPIE